MMSKSEAASSSLRRRGFLRNLFLAVAGAFGVTALGKSTPAEPKEKELREADFYKKHDLAG